MSKTKLLLDVVSDLRSLAGSIQAVAESMVDNEPAKAVQPKTPVPEPESKPEKKPIPLEQVRAVLAEKSHNGFTAEVRGLLEKHGAKKLSEIDPANYAALIRDAEGMK